MERGWRFIDTGVNNAYLNMAVDEAILDAHIHGLVPPTLRVYRWSPPALSLGYSQAIEPSAHSGEASLASLRGRSGQDGEVDLVKCQEHGIDVVRRLTGGRAVLHHQELTYSVTVSIRDDFPESVAGSYRYLSRGLIACYRILGIDVCLQPGQRNPSSAACFLSPTLADLTYQGRKLAGSAQVRKRNALLQHGSLPIHFDARLLFSLFKFPSDVYRERALAAFSQKTITLGEILGGDVGWQELKEALLLGFQQALRIRFHRNSLTKQEIQQSQELASRKYSSYEWNHRR